MLVQITKNYELGHSIKNVFNNGAAEATAKTKATDLNISTLSANPALINQLVIGDAVAFQKNSLYQYLTTLIFTIQSLLYYIVGTIFVVLVSYFYDFHSLVVAYGNLILLILVFLILLIVLKYLNN